MSPKLLLLPLLFFLFRKRGSAGELDVDFAGQLGYEPVPDDGAGQGGGSEPDGGPQFPDEVLPAPMGTSVSPALPTLGLEVGMSPTHEVSPDALLGLVNSEPTPGAFYQIVQGDNLTSVVKRALRAGLGREPESSETVRGMQAVTADPYNRSLFGTNPPNGTPSYLVVNGAVVTAAFYPRHFDYRYVASQGARPARSVDVDGNRISGVGNANTFGALWIPSLGSAQSVPDWLYEAPEASY